MILALALILLVQADDFVRFDICYLNTKVFPPELQPDPKGGYIFVRKSTVSAIESLPENWSGIACVKLRDSNQGLFVVGTEDEVRKILE